MFKHLLPNVSSFHTSGFEKCGSAANNRVFQDSFNDENIICVFVGYLKNVNFEIQNQYLKYYIIIKKCLMYFILRILILLCLLF